MISGRLIIRNAPGVKNKLTGSLLSTFQSEAIVENSGDNTLPEAEDSIILLLPTAPAVSDVTDYIRDISLLLESDRATIMSLNSAGVSIHLACTLQIQKQIASVHLDEIVMDRLARLRISMFLRIICDPAFEFVPRTVLRRPPTLTRVRQIRL